MAPSTAIEDIECVASAIADAATVSCMTGAGVSAESGIATFRGPGGLWEGERPEDVATPDAFRRDPDKVWRFYRARRRALARCAPNPGHFALAELGRLHRDFRLITQNVDGLHRAAGSSNVIELHGDLCIDRCSKCNWTGPFDPPIEGDVAARSAAPGQQLPGSHVQDRELPVCKLCGALLRPAVVWFGEMLPVEALQAAERAAQECQVMLVVGTSSLVHPAASLAYWAQAAGAMVVEVNPQTTELSSFADVCLKGPSGTVLPALVGRVREMKGRSQ